MVEAIPTFREARIWQLGGIPARIDDALEQTDLSLLPPEKLLDMRLKNTTSQKEEYVPFHRPEKGCDPETGPYGNEDPVVHAQGH